LEIWVPYGDVESLLTLQAENLGELVDVAPENHAEELALILKERVKGLERILVCDSKPATLKLLKALAPHLPQDGTIKLNAPSPKSVEEGVPEIKGRVTKLSPPTALARAEGGEHKLPPELTQGKNLVLATGQPDPLYGFSDARVAAALSYVTGARKLAYDSREGDNPAFLQETKAYAAVSSLLESARESIYVTIITKGGQPFSMIDGGAKDASGHYVPQTVSPAKGVVIGAGGKGYDDTFSQLLRLSMGALGAVRKGGDVLLIGECKEGIGSDALQMQAQGRISDASLRRGFYADGMEEIGYLSRLKDNFSITLLSSLPDLYATSRFRFKAAKSSSEALQKVFSSAGRGAKLHVFTRASETLLA
jgi:hypothetical protein